MQHQFTQVWWSSWNWPWVVWPASFWLFQEWLIFSSRISLFPLPWGQFSELWQLMSWLQSGHHVVNFFHLVWFPIIQNSSQDMAQNIIYSPWGGTKGPWLYLMTNYHYLVSLDWVPLFLHVLTSLIKLTLRLKLFHGQEAGGGHGVGAGTTGSCFASDAPDLHL